MTTEGAPSLSDRLLRAREARGETVEQVNQLIGISPKLLRGLESGQLDIVEPVYVLLALKSYAEHLELDVDEMLRMLEAELNVATKPKPIEVTANAGDGASMMTGGAAWVADALEMLRRLPQAQRLAFVAAVVLIVVFLALWFTGNLGDGSAQSISQPDATTESVTDVTSPADAAAPTSPGSTDSPSAANPRPSQQPDNATAQAAVPTPATEAPLATDAADVPAIEDVNLASTENAQTDSAGRSEIVTSAQNDERQEVPIQAIAGGAVDGSNAPIAADVAAESSDHDLAVPPQEHPEEPRAILEPTTASNEVASSLLTLEAEAVDSTWVQIQWDGGAGGTEVVIPRGERQRWQAREFFMVKAGRAHGVRFYLEGKLLGNGRLGDPTEVLRFRASKDSVTLLSRDLQPLSQLSVEHDFTASD